MGKGAPPPPGPAAPQVVKRKLHWQLVPRQVIADTVYCHPAFPKPHALDLSELYTHFSSTVTATGPGAAGRGKAQNKPERVHLVPLKRANNVCIQRSRVKLSNEELRALLTFEDTSLYKLLSPEDYASLIAIVPTKEELDLTTGYRGDVSLLGECEKFL
jgi:hypothetical protein